MRLPHLISGLLVIIVLFSSCRKPTTANWDVDVAIPLVNSTLSIKNFIGDTIFKADNTGLLNFYVTREVTAIKMDSLLSLPDTLVSKTFTLPVIQQYTFGAGQAMPFFPATDLKFDISNGVALKTIDMRSGSLTMSFSNKVDQPLDLVYLIPSATKNGLPLTISETIPPGDNSLVKSYDLSGYTLNMRGQTGNEYNTLVQEYTVTVNANATSVVTLTQALSYTVAAIGIEYKNLVPQYVEGYFGQQTIQMPQDTVELNLINNFQANNFMLSDATLNFKIQNAFGVDFRGSLSNIKAINSINNSVVQLNASQLSDININRATKVANTPSISTKIVSLNSANSNIAPFLSNLPDKLSYQGSINVNPSPLANASGYYDFAFYDKGIHVQADINIPMRFNASSFQLKSKAAVELGSIEQFDNVKGGNFVVLATNGYPFKVQLQAYMLDEGGSVVDSLFVPGQNVIESGQLDNQNVVVSPNFSKVLIPVTVPKIGNMRRTRSIQIITRLLMPPNPPDIKIYEHYKIDVNIVAEVTYNVERK
jgi:hypothetical protein